MRKCLPYLIAAALAEIPLALAQSNLVPFSITINSATNIVKAGSEVRIRLVFTNTSGEEIPYVRSPVKGVEPEGEFFTDVEVHDVKGDLAPETKYHRLIRGKHDTSPTPGAQKKAGAALATSDVPEPKPRIGGSFMTVSKRPRITPPYGWTGSE